MGRYYCLIVLMLAVRLQAAEPEVNYFAPGIDLPDDEGKALILRSCTGCHTLEGVPAYRKYWGFDRWLPMVENMVKHGSVLSAQESIIVARYLGRHFGTDVKEEKP
jgi:hypothetical protein